VRGTGRAAAFVLAATGVFGAHLVLGVMRHSFTRVAGDEGTYLAMTESLVRDGDLRFSEADRVRTVAAEEPGRRTLILQRTERGIAYSKPIVYPLVAALFLALSGDAGLLALNALALAGALALAVRTLARWWGAPAAAWTLLAAVGASVVPSYLAYRMSDLLQAALVLAGLALCLHRVRGGPAEGTAQGLPTPVAGRPGPTVAGVPTRSAGGEDSAAGRPRSPGRTGERRKALWAAGLGGLLLGLAASARYPNLLVLVVAIACLVVARRPRAAAATLAGGVLAVVLLSAATARLTGTANPYKAERASFDPASGYPVAADSTVAQEGFNARLATQTLGARPVWQPSVSAWSAAYYLAGRHTGLLLYFPAIAVLVVAALRRSDRLAWMLLGGAAAGIVFYVVWMPRNYFGGSTFVGDRYFLTLFPLLLFAPARAPGRPWLAWPWLVGLAVWASAVVSVARTGELDRTSQSHAYAGVFRLLPYESTARAVDGWRDRYWEETFWRFTDPWATAGEDAFLLAPGRPRAETLVATRKPLEALRLTVHSDAPEVVLEVSDWKRTRTLTVDTSGPAGRAVVEVAIAPAWRRHPFWWAPGVPYDVRALRWRTLGDAPARVRLLGTAPAGG